MLLNHIYKEMSLFGACQHQRYETQRIGRCKGRLHALQKACLESPRFQQRNTSCSVQLVQTLLKQFLILSNRLNPPTSKEAATQCRRRSPNVAINRHSRTELRPPTARKSHPNFFAHCKRSTKMKKYKKLSSQMCKSP